MYLDGSNAENKIALLVILCIIMYVKKNIFKTDIFLYKTDIFLYKTDIFLYKTDIFLYKTDLFSFI